MARHEQDREDLLAEATALVRRAELRIVGFEEPIIAGFRRDGGLSVYFGPDPAYHLDPQGRLKRAFRAGRLYRTQGTTLAELTRERTGTATILHRRDLPPAECETFLAEMHRRLTDLLARHQSGELRIEGQIPQTDASFWPDIEAAVARTGDRSSLLLAPRYKGKR